MLRMGLGMVAILAPLQLVIGRPARHQYAKHQPDKVAAIEAHWEDSGPIPLLLFAWPDQQRERNHDEIGIPPWREPHHHARAGTAACYGAQGRSAGQRPPVAPVFFSFRVMVGLGMVMLAWAGWVVAVETPPAVRGHPLVPALVGHGWRIGFVAMLWPAGWSPRSAGSRGSHVACCARGRGLAGGVRRVLVSLVLFVLCYFVVFSVGIWYASEAAWSGAGARAPSCRGRPDLAQPAARAARDGPMPREGIGAGMNNAPVAELLPVLLRAGARIHRRHVRGAGWLRPGHRHAVPVLPPEHDRDLVMNSVAPFWDGNETWLVLGGVTLWAARSRRRSAS